MSVSIPLIKTKKKQKKLPQPPQGEVSAYDIILGKVEIDPEYIPYYLQVLKQYEDECGQEARYIEAEMAKHKRDELKQLAVKVEKEKAVNLHLKEKIDVEEAYLKEFNDFQTKWEKKLQKFEEKVEESRQEMLEHQKEQLKDHLNRVEEKFAVKMKEFNNDILNMQKIEKSLAKQKKYIEAQKKREEWQKAQENLAIKQRMKIDQKKNKLINDYELRNKKEIDEFVDKINEMRVNLENERKKELDKLMTKYDRIKKQLDVIQKSETKRIENRKQKVTDIDDTIIKDASSFTTQHPLDRTLNVSKKKVLLHKIKKLNNKGFQQILMTSIQIKLFFFFIKTLIIIKVMKIMRLERFSFNYRQYQYLFIFILKILIVITQQMLSMIILFIQIILFLNFIKLQSLSQFF